MSVNQTQSCPTASDWRACLISHQKLEYARNSLSPDSRSQSPKANVAHAEADGAFLPALAAAAAIRRLKPSQQLPCPPPVAGSGGGGGSDVGGASSYQDIDCGSAQQSRHDDSRRRREREGGGRQLAEVTRGGNSGNGWDWRQRASDRAISLAKQTPDSGG